MPFENYIRNKDALREWVKALMSGKYKQTKRVLHSIDDNNRHEYCCLGVLCELYKDELQLHTRLSQVPMSGIFVSYDGETGILPTAMREFLGVNVGDPVINEYPNGDFLLAANANDMQNLSFEQIAYNINEYYKLGMDLKALKNNANDPTLS